MNFLNKNSQTAKIEDPYEVWIIDDVLAPDIPEKIIAEWPTLDDPRWFAGIQEVDGEKNILEQGMYSLSSYEKTPPFTKKVLTYFHSTEFTQELSAITGREGLLPDESYRWSGMRTVKKAGFQLIHSDARKNPLNGKRKELTVLYYLNKNYNRKTDEGCLEVWNDDMKACMHTIEPKYNRMVIFACTDTSYHGVPIVTKDRSFLTFSVVHDGPATDRHKALFVPRPWDSEEVRELGLKRSIFSAEKY